MTNSDSSTISKQEAKDFGAVSTKQRKDGCFEAVFTSISSMARFSSELRRRSIPYSERFTADGKAIRFCWSGR